MKYSKTIAAVLLIATTSAFAAIADPDYQGAGYEETYAGGSLAGIKPGEAVIVEIDGKSIAFIHTTRVQSFWGKGSERHPGIKVTLPIHALTGLTYSEESHHRIGTGIAVAAVSLGAGLLVAASKSKKHYIGITWDDAGQKGGLTLQADKNNFRGLLTALEGMTGLGLNGMLTPVSPSKN